MHRHRDSHGIRRSLTECRCAAANEKSAREPGREPEMFHDSDELTNLAAEAQQNVRECHCSEKGERPLLRREKRTIARLNLRNVNGANRKIFIDRLLWRRLKVESSGVKWAIAPRDNGRRFPTRTLLRRRVPAFH